MLWGVGVAFEPVPQATNIFAGDSSVEANTTRSNSTLTVNTVITIKE